VQTPSASDLVTAMSAIMLLGAYAKIINFKVLPLTGSINRLPRTVTNAIVNLFLKAYDFQASSCSIESHT
jgi:hypothetical protein